MSIVSPERLLRVLLWLLGLLLLPALFAAFLPIDSMAEIHRGLGLGDWPEGPLPVYLARAASLAYAVQIGLYFLAASDVYRYRPLVLYLGAVDLLLGIAMLRIDWTVGMPAFWTWTEGPVKALFGGLILILALRLRSARPGPSDARWEAG